MTKLLNGAIYDETTKEIEKHLHPEGSYGGPSARTRYAAITFTTAANNENVVVGDTGSEITYTFKTVLGAPAANNVEVKVLGTVDLTIRKLAEALAGAIDAANIAYGAGVGANPAAYGLYTSQRFSIGTTAHVAGSSIVFQEKTADRTDAAYPMTITSTTTRTLTAWVRVYSTRYLMSGNAAALGDRVAGPYQTILPMGSVRDSSGRTVKYDPDLLIVEGTVSAGRIVECDAYYSADEVTFVLLIAGVCLSRETTTQGSQQYTAPMRRIPAGAGLYIKMRSDGTNTADWQDLKFQIHAYPYGL